MLQFLQYPHARRLQKLPSASLLPGALVVIRRERWRVAAVTDTGGIVRIDASRLGASRLGATLLGSDAPSTVAFFTPFDQIDDVRSRWRPRRVRRQRWHAALAGLRAHAEHVELPLSALTADMQIWPYQLEPLLAMRRGARRLLIADAVGLGKTIQAGLIVAELIRRGEAARVLIAAPSHLCRQWREELLARFQLTTRIADAAALTELAAALPREINPWSIAGVWIASLDFLKQPHVLDALPPHPWDLVVIDEAHTITGHSERRATAQRLTSAARRVLLLTATPVSGPGDGRGLTAMGKLSARDALTVFRRSRADVGIESRRRTRTVRVTPSDAECHALDLVDAFAAAAMASARSSTADATHLLIAVLAKRALSTCAALAISADRRLAHLSGIAVAAPDRAQRSFDFDDGDDDVAALTAAIGMAADRERSWMRRLSVAARSAARVSRKMSRLLTLLRRAREPVIVFTEFRDSLEAVATALARRHVSFTRAHGALTTMELQSALDAFCRGDVRILLATDVASQGLNLHQSARWIIHLDLPWNPIRIEQRAGRVDRMGQTRDVHVTQLVLSHPRDRAFTARLAERAEAATSNAAFVSDTRWRRRARAAAVVLKQRHRWAVAWRSATLRGRPLAKRGRDLHRRICDVDIDGAETLVLGSADGRRVQARVRRVMRLSAARAKEAAAVERALRARMPVGAPQPALPGALPATEVRRAGIESAAAVAARQTSEARIESLERASRLSSPAVATHLRFLSD